MAPRLASSQPRAITSEMYFAEEAGPGRTVLDSTHTVPSLYATLVGRYSGQAAMYLGVAEYPYCSGEDGEVYLAVAEQGGDGQWSEPGPSAWNRSACCCAI